MSLLKLGYKKTQAFVVDIVSLALRETSSHAMSYPMKVLVAGNCGGPLANSQQGTKALCPIAHKELNLAKIHTSELRSGSSLGQLGGSDG